MKSPGRKNDTGPWLLKKVREWYVALKNSLNNMVGFLRASLRFVLIKLISAIQQALKFCRTLLAGN